MVVCRVKWHIRRQCLLVLLQTEQTKLQQDTYAEDGVVGGGRSWVDKDALWRVADGECQWQRWSVSWGGLWTSMSSDAVGRCVQLRLSTIRLLLSVNDDWVRSTQRQPRWHCDNNNHLQTLASTVCYLSESQTLIHKLLGWLSKILKFYTSSGWSHFGTPIVL